MPVTLRPYQKEAVQAAVRHFRGSDAPACIVLPTGAGKSLVIAELARLAKGKVLVLSHVKELCEQNHKKHAELGGRAGIFAAGLNRKEADEQVTFASVQSVARNLDAFADPRSLLIIDECHRVSGEDESQYGQVTESLRQRNPRLKVLGLTATPYRLGLGWIYRFHHRGMVRSEEPRPFETCIYELSLRKMIEEGFLTRPRIEDAPIAQYDFSVLEQGRFGEYREADVNRLLVSHQRVTEAIVRQVVDLADAGKRRGVMIFAATVDHAREIAGYLPPERTALVLGETSAADRDHRIAAFKRGELHYLVNVAVLTTGFDAPHVDLIAILRPTQSVSLFQQIVGRGLRLAPGKQSCLVVDYAGNGFDVFYPEVGEQKPSRDSLPVEVVCPACDFVNLFWGKKDESGHVLEHFGRRCGHFSVNESGARVRCEYRFRFKECGACTAENDIAARRCCECDAPIIDPDDVLKKCLKLKDAMVLRVAGITFEARGELLSVTYHDEQGETLSERFDLGHAGQRAVFNRVFGRRLASGRRPMRFERAKDVLTLGSLIPAPDFVVARKNKRFWRIQERVFDYVGRFRKANSC